MTPAKRFIPRVRIAAALSGVFCSSVLLACQSSVGQPLEANLNTPPTEIGRISETQIQIQQEWKDSPHGNTYDLEKGPNTYCARCHSPVNWDPSAVIDPPPNCVSCKFSFESEPRIALGNPLVSEQDWDSINCNICHEVIDGIVSPQISWLNTQTGYHETVSSSSDLCGKCHVNSEPFLNHYRDLGVGTHADFVCTSCHDPHTVRASCGDSECHADVLVEKSLPTSDHAGIQIKDACVECHPQEELIHTMDTDHTNGADCLGCHQPLVNLTADKTAPVYHSVTHNLITCVACHDASNLDVGPVQDQAIWTTFRTLNTPVGPQTTPYRSHNLQNQVDCERCHFKGNPWELRVVETDEIP